MRHEPAWRRTSLIRGLALLALCAPLFSAAPGRTDKAPDRNREEQKETAPIDVAEALGGEKKNKGIEEVAKAVARQQDKKRLEVPPGGLGRKLALTTEPENNPAWSELQKAAWSQISRTSARFSLMDASLSTSQDGPGDLLSIFRTREVARTWNKEREKLLPAFQAVRNLPGVPKIPENKAIVNLMEFTGSLHDAIRRSLYDAVPAPYWGASSELPLDGQQLAAINRLTSEIRRVDRALQTYDAPHKTSFETEPGPDAKPHGPFRWEKTADSTVIFDKDTDPNRAMVVSFTKLPGRGDNINVVTAQGRYLIIDTGFGSSALDAFSAIKARRREGQEPLRISLIVTHRDADHLSGLLDLLASEGANIDEIIVGVGPGQDSNLWLRTRDELNRRFKGTPGPGMFHFVREDLPKQQVMLKSDATRESDGMFVHDLHTLEDLEIKLLRLRDPKSENGASIITRLSYRGRSTLLLGDASPEALMGLLKQRQSLRSNVLKFPHHLWLPKDGREKEILAELLRAVKPELIVFSNIGAASHRMNFEPLRIFIESVLPGVLLKWTEEADDTKVILRRWIPLCPSTYASIVRPSMKKGG